MTSFNTNAFWGSSDFDTFPCQTPPTQDFLNNPPNWDNLFNFTESIDPKASLDLLQGPLPYTYEPADEWLVEFKRLQDVHNRAQAFGVPDVSAPLYHKQNTFATSNMSSYAPETSSIYPSQPQQDNTKFAKKNGQAYVRDKTGHATPSSLRHPHSTDSRSPGLYNWNPTPTNDDHDVQKVIKGLREIERSLQADTKRRMSQIEQSRPR